MLSKDVRIKKIQQGFTLVELMITVAIIGVLAAIAIPQYESYVSNARAVRLISELSDLRLTIEMCLQKGKTRIGRSWNECNPNATASSLIQGNSQVGVVLPRGVGVAQVTNPLSATSSIEATVANNVSPALNGKRLVWQRATSGEWKCHSNLDKKYLTGHCNYDASL